MFQRLVPYATALGFALAAVTARAVLTPWLGTMQPFAVGLVAVAASVLFCGWRPAVAAAAICFMGGRYLSVPPGVTPTWTTAQDVAVLVTYGTSAGLLIAMGHRARRAEQQLSAANDSLREADRRKDEFLAALSHELRNPIGVISTAVTVLEHQATDPREQHTLSILARQSALVRRLVDDLLDVGRITRGRLAMHPELVDLRTCVADATNAGRLSTARKAQALRVDLPDAPVVAPADQARIVQVIGNLVDNASKYSPDGADIAVQLSAAGDRAVIVVSDTGPGIDPVVLPRVFDLFDQGGTSTSGGLGLGLGLCKRIVEMHGGTIAAGTNHTGHGARVEVTLPIQPSAAVRVAV